MQSEEAAPSLKKPVVAAPPRVVRLDAVRPAPTGLPAEIREEVAALSGARPEEPSEPVTAAGPVAPLPEIIAPRRAVPLTAKRPVTEAEKLAHRQAREERARAEAEAARRPALEKRIAALYDAGDMLRVMDTELALRRAQRLSGGGGNSRQTLRVLSIAALFALLIAALGAMAWMQDRLARTGFSRHRVEVRAGSGR